MNESTSMWLRGLLARTPYLLDRVHRVLGRPCEIRVLRKIVPRGGTVLDVGANIGQFAQPLAHLVGPSGKVHSFEPTPATFAKLSRGLSAMTASGRVVLNPIALSEKTGKAAIYLPDAMGLEASLAPHAGFSSWGQGDSPVPSFEATVGTVDEYVRAAGIDSVDLLKIDVEGAEMLVLRGARALLESSRPPLLLIEVWSLWTRDFGYSPRDLFTFLADTAGYRFYQFLKSDLRPVNIHSESEPGQFPRFINFLGVTEPAHQAAVQQLRRAGLIRW